MALSELITRLEKDAERRRAEVLASGEAQARELLRRATQARQDARAQELSRLEQERRARLDALEAKARREARTAVLEAQTRALGRLLERARAHLPRALDDARCAPAVASQLARALTYVEEAAPEVRCHPRLLEVVRAQVGPRGQVVEDCALGPGFILSAAGGAVSIDGRWEAALAALEPALAVELLPQEDLR